jgi:hypothetical protein
MYGSTHACVYLGLCMFRCTDVWNPNVHYSFHKNSPLVPIANKFIRFLSILFLCRTILAFSSHIRQGILIDLFFSCYPIDTACAFLTYPRPAICIPHLTLFNFISVIRWRADHSGRAVWGMKCLRPLEHWGRGFESHSRHGCLFVFILCLC